MAKKEKKSRLSKQPAVSDGTLPKLEPRKYNNIVASSSLEDIRLVSSSFDVTPEYFLTKNKEENFNLSYDFKITMAEYDADDGFLAGCFEWTAVGKVGRKNVIKIKTAYMIVYTCEKGLERQYPLAFMNQVGRFATFPYFRATVGQYSAASGADLPILPVLKQPIKLPVSIGIEH